MGDDSDSGIDRRFNLISEITTSIRGIVYFISVHYWVDITSTTGWVRIGSGIPILLMTLKIVI